MQNIQQSHRSGPLHQTNKAHKGGRHNRKSSASSEIKTKSLNKPVTKVKRDERFNQAAQNRKLKRERVFDEKRKLGVESQPPLLIGVLDLHMNDCRYFLKGIHDHGEEGVLSYRPLDERSAYVISNRLKMRFKLIALDSTNFDESLDIVKTLDLMILLHHPATIEQDEDFDTAHLLRAIHIHCLPTIVHVIDGLNMKNDDATPKNLLHAKRVLRAKITDEKMHCVERPSDFMQLFHTLGNCKRQASLFKEARPSIVPDKVELIDGSITFTGFVRRAMLSANDLVHVIGYDDFQIGKIDILPDIVALRPASLEGSQIVQSLLSNPMKQETLETENEIDPMEGEQTFPTTEELSTEAERRNTRKIVKKLPPGTSEYQGAWIPEDSGDEQSLSDDDEDGDARMMDIPEEGSDDESILSQSEGDDEHGNISGDDVASTMDVDAYDRNISQEKELKILEKLKEARAEETFPDEIDTPSDIPARIRFARYRGLKSFRTSQWDPQENLPPDYNRIFQFQNFQQTKRRVLNECRNREDEEGANPGQYVRVHLANVPTDIVDSLLKRSIPPTLIGLLKYERKMTVLNLLVKRVADGNLNHPIKSKDELIFHVGFRKFKARPLFTTHGLSSKFKYERFLRDDVAMVATIYAPITFPPAPVLVFRMKTSGQKELVASGSVLDSNPNRLVIKRIRLSGHPFKIHSKTAVVRFMFFNREDVLYFKPVELATKYNRRGHISEPLGTHGHMKCTFDKKIRSDDCIFMNLYKRVFPKWTYSPLINKL